MVPYDIQVYRDLMQIMYSTVRIYWREMDDNYGIVKQLTIAAYYTKAYLKLLH